MLTMSSINYTTSNVIVSNVQFPMSHVQLSHCPNAAMSQYPLRSYKPLQMLCMVAPVVNTASLTLCTISLLFPWLVRNCTKVSGSTVSMMSWVLIPRSEENSTRACWSSVCSLATSSFSSQRLRWRSEPPRPTCSNLSSLQDSSSGSWHRPPTLDNQRYTLVPSSFPR